MSLYMSSNSSKYLYFYRENTRYTLEINFKFPSFFVEQIQILEQIHNNRVRPPWSVRRARLEGEDIGTINNMIGSSQGISGRPANHEDSLSDALEGPAADEWSFREPNHSNGVDSQSFIKDYRK